MELAEQILRELKIYSDAENAVMQQAAEEALERANAEIERHITFNRSNSDDYVKAWAIAKGDRGNTKSGAVWYVKPPHYRLTHLLEHGHRLRDGKSSSKAFPHIEYGETLAVQIYEELLRERL